MEKNQSTYNKFGKKIRELIYLVNNTEDWEQYVENNTVKLINDLLTYNNISTVMEKNDIKYNNLRSKYLNAAKRIKEKDKTRIRSGKSIKAQQLFSLMESTPNWQDVLTEKEVIYVLSFEKYKNFYEVGRQLNANPSNIAGAIYGTKQRLGAIGKIKKLKEQQNNC